MREAHIHVYRNGDWVGAVSMRRYPYPSRAIETWDRFLTEAAARAWAEEQKPIVEALWAHWAALTGGEPE